MSPSGGGEGNPAWDFQVLAPRIHMGQEYSLKARCAVDRWQGEKWVEARAASWGEE